MTPCIGGSCHPFVSPMHYTTKSRCVKTICTRSKKKTYAQSQNLTSPGLSADCDGLALGHPHMHSRVSSRTGWTSWPTENTLSRIRRTQLPVRWKKSFLLCVFSTFYSNSACASLEELIMFVLSCSRALYFTASSSKQTAFYVETQLHLWRNFLQFNP